MAPDLILNDILQEVVQFQGFLFLGAAGTTYSKKTSDFFFKDKKSPVQLVLLNEVKSIGLVSGGAEQ